MQVCDAVPVPAPLDFDPIAEARRQWRERWGAAPTPAMAAVTSIMRVQQILMARLNELLEPFELTFPRYEALMLLRLSRAGALPLGKMGERLQVHPTSVTKIVDQLERAGLVRRESAEGDRRLILATITERGRETADAATAVLNDERFATRPLRRDDLERLWELLRGVRLAAGDFRPRER
jgi:DNA-binding MarR family transcriptional regulator